MSKAMVALANLTLGAAQATVTFSSIPSTYRDLRLVVTCKMTTATVYNIQVNGDTSANYPNVSMSSANGAANSSSSTTSTSMPLVFYNTLAIGDVDISTTDIMDYSVTDKHKTFLGRTNHPGEAVAYVGRWANTPAITSLTVNSGSTFQASSTFALYGVVA